jgi:hypothetical protein
MGAIGLAAFGRAGIGATLLAAERFVRRRAARNWPLGIHQALPANVPGRTRCACVRVRRDRGGVVSQTNRLTNASDSTERDHFGFMRTLRWPTHGGVNLVQCPYDGADLEAESPRADRCSSPARRVTPCGRPTAPGSDDSASPTGTRCWTNVDAQT